MIRRVMRAHELGSPEMVGLNPTMQFLHKGPRMGTDAAYIASLAGKDDRDADGVRGSILDRGRGRRGGRKPGRPPGRRGSRPSGGEPRETELARLDTRNPPFNPEHLEELHGETPESRRVRLKEFKAACAAVPSVKARVEASGLAPTAPTWEHNRTVKACVDGYQTDFKVRTSSAFLRL